VGANPEEGLAIHYYLPKAFDSTELKLKVFDKNNQLLAAFTSKKDENYKSYPGGPGPNPVVPVQKGINRFYWNFRKTAIPGVKEVFVLGDYNGTPVPPGEYTIALVTPADSLTTTGMVLANPNVKASPADYEEQYQLMSTIDESVRQMHEQVSKVRSIKQQLESTTLLLNGYPNTDTIGKAAKKLSASVDAWQGKLVSTQQETFQDVINFYNQLNAEMLDLRGRMDNANQPKVPEGHKTRLAALQQQWNQAGIEYQNILKDLEAFNLLYRKLELPAILIPGS
jgi:hypothetical protein